MHACARVLSMSCHARMYMTCTGNHNAAMCHVEYFDFIAAAMACARACHAEMHMAIDVTSCYWLIFHMSLIYLINLIASTYINLREPELPRRLDRPPPAKDSSPQQPIDPVSRKEV